MSSRTDIIDKHASVGLETPEPVSVHYYIAETRPWYRVGHLRMLTLAVFLVSLSSTNTGYDGSMLNGLQSLEYWQKDMDHPTGQKLGALSNGYFFGSIIAFPIAPWLADRFGRKWCIIVGQTVGIVGAILQGCSTSYGFFLGARIFLGFGTAIACTSSPALVSEISYPTHRETCTFGYNICWYCGALIASWVTYGTRTLEGKASWTIPSFLQGSLALIQLTFFWLVPESPRYLVNKGNVEAARKILSKFHTGDSTDPRDMALVDFELQEIEGALAHEKLNAGTSYLDFVKVKNFRKRGFLCLIMGVMMQLSGSGLVSYYLVKVLESIGITDTKRQLQISGCLTIYNFLICATMTSICRFFKRRTIFITCFSGMLVTYILWTALSAINQQKDFQDTSYANGVLAMIFLYYFFYDVGVNGLPFLYITEVLPYSHRTKGLNLLLFSTYATMIYNGYVNPIAMDAIEWKYYIVYCCIIAVELLIVIFTFPETSGYTLEEVAQVFGDEAPEIGNRKLASAKASMELSEEV